MIPPYIDLCLILLTYKGKVLLLQQENMSPAPNRNLWHFIKKIKAQDTSPEKTIIQEVEKETQITLDAVTLLSSAIHEDILHYAFHAKLTDTHVNNLSRAEGQLLQFFELKEVNKLQLQPSTQLFFLQNRDRIENLAIS